MEADHLLRGSKRLSTVLATCTSSLHTPDLALQSYINVVPVPSRRPRDRTVLCVSPQGVNSRLIHLEVQKHFIPNVRTTS